MSLPEAVIHSFVIRIWLEESSESGAPAWRGHITHIPSNRRRYLQSACEIANFVQQFLIDHGVSDDSSHA
jgi:hypothetical protein